MNKVKTFAAIVAAVLMCSVLVPLHLQAQDTLSIAALPAGNINNVINGDTLAGGVRAHPNRVYRLRHGSVYQVTQPMIINGSIHIVANDTTAGLRPPVLAPAILTDNSSIDHFFEFTGKGAMVDISNIYLLSQRADNNWLGWSAGMRIWADSVAIKLRGVVFDGFSEAGIRVYAQWTKLNVQDCNFRNCQHSSSWFGGQPFMTDAPNALDTVKFINNTFLANNSYSWSIRGYDKYSLFEHNTMVYGTVNPFLIRQGSHLHLKNNIFYAMHAMGGNPDHVINSWFLNYPDTSSSSVIRVRGRDTVSYWYHLWGKSPISGPNVYEDNAHGVTAAMLDPHLRVIDVRNNAYFWPQKLLDFYKMYNDTVRAIDSIQIPQYDSTNEVAKPLKRILYKPTWMSNYTKWTVDTLLPSLGATVSISGNTETDPGFAANVASHIDSLIAYIDTIAATGFGPGHRWAYPNNTLYPPTWPLPENLAYSNTSLQHAGTDGFALGDLNWFPTQKAQWLLTAVQKPITGAVPNEYRLYDAYPNPFNPTTNIRFSVPVSGSVSLKVYNIIGQEVTTLVNERKSAGTYEVQFDGNNLSSGVYFYRLTAGNYVETKKLVLMK